MSDVDPIIGSDFGALRETTARLVPGFDATARRLLGEGDPYRAPEPGAEARVRVTRDRRLRELALLPLHCQRVFVHRVSRAAAGATALIAVAVTALVSMDAWTHDLVYALVGPPSTVLAAALLGGAALAAYVLAGLIAERVYEHKVGATVDAGEDVFEDLDRLEGRGPIDEAQRLIDRVDAAAVALPLAGVISGGLVLGLLAFFADVGFSALTVIDASLDVLAPAVGAGVLAGVLLGRAAVHDRRSPGGSALLAAASHGSMLAVGAGVVLLSLWYALRAAFGLHALGVIPDATTSWTLAGLGVLALALPTTWLILWLRRREHRAVGR